MHASVHQAFGMESFQANLWLYIQQKYNIGAICDWACKIRTYLHIKICPIFELRFAEYFKVILVKSLYHASNHLIFNEENTVDTT